MSLWKPFFWLKLKHSLQKHFWEGSISRAPMPQSTCPQLPTLTFLPLNSTGPLGLNPPASPDRTRGPFSTSSHRCLQLATPFSFVLYTATMYFYCCCYFCLIVCSFVLCCMGVVHFQCLFRPYWSKQLSPQNGLFWSQLRVTLVKTIQFQVP